MDLSYIIMVCGIELWPVGHIIAVHLCIRIKLNFILVFNQIVNFFQNMIIIV